MSLRATTDHIDDYGREHLFEIYDDQWGGGVSALKNTGRGFGQFSHQVLDPKKPWENPIQKGVLELSVWLSSTDLLDDIKDGDEQQFHIIHKIDSTQEWAGYIYNDLTTYEENILPFRVTLVAKDFTDLGGKDFLVSSALPDNRETVITTIATLLNEVGFDIPIKTHTSWIEDNITSSQDYLRQINHETKALREFGRTGDESDTAITVEEALNKLCSNHKLILKQTGGAYWIDQLTAYDNPASVQETVYDIDGSLDTAETNVDTTVSANTTDLKVVISSDNRDNSGLPGLKRAKVKFDHRTEVQNIQFPSRVETDGSTNISETFSQFFVSDGDQVINLDVRGTADHGALPENSKGRVQIKAGSYWWNDATRQWVGTNTVNEFDLTVWTLQKARGFVSFQTETTPSDADGQLEITFLNAIDDNGAADATVYDEIVFSIDNQVGEENTTSIDYVLTQSGGFSVVEDFEDDWYGDGPIGYAVSALRHGSGDGDTTSDSWGRRGQTADKNFHENQLKEPMDLRRGWRRLLTALLKGVYYPHNVLSYDSEFFYYLGGRWDLFTGNFQADLFSLDIVTGSDTFEDTPKFTDETGSGSGSTGGSTGGSGGIDQSTADARYFKQASLLSEVSSGDLPTLYGNIGLDDGSADLDLNSLDINGSSFVDSSRNVSANEGTFSGTLWGKNGEKSLLLSAGDTGTGDGDDVQIQFGFEGTDTYSQWLTTRHSPTAGLNQIRFYTGDGTQNGVFPTNAVLGLTISNGDVGVTNTLTINSQLLFTAGNEQLLSTDASPTFAGLSVNETDTTFFTQLSGDNQGGASTALALRNPYTDNNTSTWLRMTNSTAADTTAGRVDLRATRTNDPSTGRSHLDIWADTSLTSGFSNQLRIGNNGLEIRQLQIGSPGSATIAIDTSRNAFFVEGTFSGDVEVGDDLTIGGALMAEEFIVEQYRSLTNFQMTPAGGRVESVTGSAGSETVTLEDPRGNTANPFQADDIVLIKFLDTDAAILKEIYRKVASVSGVDVTFTTTGITWGTGDDVGSVEAGDFLVATGSTSSTTRDHFIRFDITGLDTPAIRFFDSVTDVDDDGDEIIRIGEVNGVGGVSSSEIGFFAGNYDSGNGNFILATENQLTLQAESFLLETNDTIFSSTTGLEFEVGGGADAGSAKTIKWLDSGSLRAGIFTTAGGALSLVGYDGSNPVVGAFINDEFSTSLPFRSTSGEVRLNNLPTSDPSSPGQLWNDSGTVKVSTTSPPSAPPAPTGVALCAQSSLGGDYLELSWNTSTGADFYDIFRGTSSGNLSYYATTTITSYDDDNAGQEANKATEYFYHVSARNESGFNSSSEVSDSYNSATAC